MQYKASDYSNKKINNIDTYIHHYDINLYLSPHLFCISKNYQKQKILEAYATSQSFRINRQPKHISRTEVNAKTSMP